MSVSRSALRHLRLCLRHAEGARPALAVRRAHLHSRTAQRSGVPVSIACKMASASGNVLRPLASRSFSTSIVRRHGHLDPPKPGEEINVSIVDQNGNKHDFQVSAGDNLLDIAQANDLEMEGACGGSCACSTCHVIVEDSDLFDKLPEAEDDENDMLDLAFGLTETSRLGCQVKMAKDVDGMVVRLPSATRNLQKSDFEKK